MLEAKKREVTDRHILFNHLREPAEQGVDGPEDGTAAQRAGLQHALHAARENERSLRQRLHRVHDPRGMELLRGLRARISGLEQLLSEIETAD